MSRSKVAVLKTRPGTVLSDYHELLNLAGYQDVVAKGADTFGDWENLQPDANGYPQVGDRPAEIKLSGLAAFWSSFKILLTCIKEAPEFAQKKIRASGNS